MSGVRVSLGPTTAGIAGEYRTGGSVPVYSKSPPIVLQQQAEDLTAGFSELVAHDDEERGLLDEQHRAIESRDWATVARTNARLIAIDGPENRAHTEGLAIHRKFAGALERFNREQFLNEKTARLLPADERPKTKNNRSQYSAPTEQLSLFGGTSYDTF